MTITNDEVLRTNTLKFEDRRTPLWRAMADKISEVTETGPIEMQSIFTKEKSSKFSLDKTKDI